MKLRWTMKAKSPKKKEKERNNNNNNKEKRRGSRSGQRTCSKKKDPGRARGRVARRRISVGLEDMQQKESTSKP